MKPGDRIVSLDGRSIEADELGIFDLAAPRFDTAPFTLGLKRGADVVTVTVSPRDFQH